MASLKKVFLLFTMLIMTLAIMAQNNVITFQAVVRDANNRLVPNEAITVTIQVQNIGGDVLYTETDNVTSNANGLISTLIGDNNPSGFAAVNWNDARIKTIVKVVSTGYEVESTLPVNAVPLVIYSSDVSPAGSTITAVYNEMQQDSLALAQRITADSMALHKATKDSAAAISTALADTANAIRNSIGDGMLTITYGSESPVTFTANQKTDANITIPSQISANNGKITITRSGESIPNGEFTLNQSDDQTINIVVPTKLSEMVNDGGHYAKRDSVNIFTAANDFTGGRAKVPSQFDINNPPTTCTQDAITICNLVAVFDSLTKRIDSISQAIEAARQEIEALKTLLVTTDSIPVNTIAANTAKVYGTVVFDGGKPDTKRGILYSTSDLNLKLNATGVDSVMSNGTGKGSYDCNLKRLVPCTQYFVRAFAFNDVDTAYGDVMNFTTLPFTCGNTLTDIDGNEYGTLQLGSQCWMQQNLRTKHFADGTSIPVGGGGLVNQTGPRRYAPSDNLNIFGYLYNWDAAMNGSASSSTNPSGVQGVCPAGWHLPSDAEWTQLTSFIASNPDNVCGNDPDNIVRSMVSSEVWNTWGACPTQTCLLCTDFSTNNSTGFSVLPAGTWHVNGALGHVSQGYESGMAIFRTATEYEGVNVQAREFYQENPYVDATAIDKTNGLSVRCVLTCPTDLAYLPTVSVVSLSRTGTTVSMTGNVLADGGATVTERGVCWGTTQHPTTSSTHKVATGTGLGNFTVSEDLTPGTTYYIRAYAINSEGTAYGAEVTYVTPFIPTVTTSAVSNIAASTATAGGNVADDEGGATVTARGVCWSTSQNPTVSDSHTTDGTGTGSFTSNITGLNALTTYYVRAYATNSAGTTYGNQVSFTTPEATPMVTTSAVSNITLDNTTINATCGGNVTDEGASAVTARGVCWSTSSNPTIAGSHTTDGSGLGSFTSSITGLTAGQTYYVRAYATNSAGTAYGNQVSFTVPLIDAKSCTSAPTVTDHEGNVYATVQIGTQCWMRENLRTTTSPKTGTYLVKLARNDPGNVYSSLGSKVAHWYSYDSTTYAPKGYGLFYNWCAAMDTANSENYMEVPTPSNVSGNNTAFSFTFTGNHRGICPVGWHVPNFSDWNTLKNNVSYSGDLSGGNDWNSSTYNYAPGNNNYAGHNVSGFAALPAGFFNSYNFQDVNQRAYFWCSMQHGSDPTSRFLYLDYNNNSVIFNSFKERQHGLSVRCIKD